MFDQFRNVGIESCGNERSEDPAECAKPFKEIADDQANSSVLF